MSGEENDLGNMVETSTLPPTAQRWLARSFPQGQAAAASFRIEQKGSMEIRGRWTEFTAVGLYSANPLAFEWKARLKMLPGVWIVAEDGHEKGAGWGGARLWGILSMGRRTDPEVLKSQLVRNLAELAWFPALALVETGLEWTAAGPNAFEVKRASGGQEAIVRFELNEQADVIRAHSPSRPYDVPDGFVDAPWRYDFGDHREFDGVRIPAEATATFEKPDGPWQYLRIKITSIGELA
jgi:hypothetical protein